MIISPPFPRSESVLLFIPQRLFHSVLCTLDVLQLSLFRLAEFGHRIVRICLVFGHELLVEPGTGLGLVSVVILVTLLPTLEGDRGVLRVHCLTYHSLVGRLCYF